MENLDNTNPPVRTSPVDSVENVPCDCWTPFERFQSGKTCFFGWGFRGKNIKNQEMVVFKMFPEPELCEQPMFHWKPRGFCWLVWLGGGWSKRLVLYTISPSTTWLGFMWIPSSSKKTPRVLAILFAFFVSIKESSRRISKSGCCLFTCRSNFWTLTKVCLYIMK